MITYSIQVSTKFGGNYMDGKTAVITGGAGAIGSACAEKFLERGYQVVLADISEPFPADKAGKLKKAFPPEMTAFCTFNAADPASICSLFDTAAGLLGSIDILVNCAGVISPAASLEVTEEQWDHVLDINLKGVFFCCQQAAKHMAASGGGSIVNISSIAAETAWPERASYAASKVGVNQLTKTLSAEWAKYGIRVNAVGPAWVDTELLGPAVAKGFIDLEKITGAIPLGRLASTADIADAVFFLSGGESGFITGQVLYVDGGYLTGSPSIAIRK